MKGIPAAALVLVGLATPVVPPALHLTHAVIIALVGDGPGAVFVLNVTASIVALLGVSVCPARVGRAAAVR